MARRLNRREEREESGPAWFAAKKHGYGAGLPIAWQGWAVLIAYMLAMIGSTVAFHDEPLAMIAIIVPATLLLLIVAARTTRGGWRWRWKKESRSR